MKDQISKTAIMGVVNITPDSFSDGGKYLQPQMALAQANKLIEHGATFIDLGAESSRPGAKALGQTEEWSRLRPVLEKLKHSDIAVSVDTRHGETMLKSIELGAAMINNIKGLADANTLRELIKSKPDLMYMAMHMHKDPKTMQDDPLDGSVAVEKVGEFFAATHRKLIDCGFKVENIFLDPGIGFGKTDSANIRLLAQISKWTDSWQIGIGISRKSFIGRTLDIENPVERDPATKMLELGLAFAGVKIIRTHDVKRLSGLLKLGNIHP